MSGMGSNSKPDLISAAGGGVSPMEWRQCPRFSAYEISESGDVRRLTGCPTRKPGTRLNGFIDTDGYLKYALVDDGGAKRHALAHRLVAEAFIGPPPDSISEVAHNNGSRIHNHYTNLRWATRIDNHHDMVVHGTGLKGECNGRAKINEADVHEIRRRYRAIKDREVRMRVSDLAAEYGLHHASLLSVAKGKSWTHIAKEEADSNV